MMSMKTLSAAGLLFVSAPAWASESYVNGQPLQYNYAYRCKGERVIVARCRDDDDSSYCQVVYPDRPYVNDMQVAPVEMRGDIVAKLNACAQTASAPASRRAAPRSGSVGTGHVPGSGAPGLGKASWAMLDFDDDVGRFFTRARMRRSGGSADGWFTIVYAKPKDFSATLADVQFTQEHFKADCVKGTYSFIEIAAFDENQKFIGSAVQADPPRRAQPGSVAEEQLNVLCGKPQKLFDKGPLTGDGDFLVFYYLALLHPDAGK